MPKRSNLSIYLIGAGVLIAILFLAWSSFFKLRGVISELSQNIQKVKLDSQVQKEKFNNIRDLKQELSDIEEQKRKMEDSLIRSDNTVEFLKAIEKVALVTENTIKVGVVDMKKLKLGGEAKKKTEDEADDAKSLEETNQEQVQKEKEASQKNKNLIGFTIELEGTYPHLVDFVYRVESLPYFIRIINLDTKASQAKTPEPASKNAGVLSTEVQAEQPVVQSKDVKTLMTILIYTNGDN